MSRPNGRTAASRRLADEGGVTLVELLVVMVFMGVIGALLVTTLSTSTQAYGQIDDETRGLSDLQTVVERLGRDLRAARGVDPGATGSLLKIWIDGNSDYVQTPDETITWLIEVGYEADGVTPTGQFDVVRLTDAGDRQVVGYSLVQLIAFAYPGAPVGQPEDSETVRVSMEYNAIDEAYASDRTATFEIRMRNAP